MTALAHLCIHAAAASSPIMCLHHQLSALCMVAISWATLNGSKDRVVSDQDQQTCAHNKSSSSNSNIPICSSSFESASHTATQGDRGSTNSNDGNGNNSGI